MKNFFSLIGILGLMFFCACQENNISDPLANLTKLSTEITRGRIPICCEICDPQSGVCRVNGCVEYTHQIVPTLANSDGLYTILLNLEMVARLCDRCMMMHPEWTIKDKSEEIVTVSEEGIALVTKNYEITNRFDVLLKVTYLVTTEGAGIAEMMIVPLQP